MLLCTWQLLGLARWANSCPGCINRLRKHYSEILGGSFPTGKASWALSRCLPTESGDYCMLINEFGMVKVVSLLILAESEVGFSFWSQSSDRN